jgi:hypothetical protein
MPDRRIVFLGHANPEDNTFTQWLSLKLAALGYHVWSDVTKLLGGEDFWDDIEDIIRNGAIKYLYVLSHASNHKLGALRELRVANATGQKEALADFVIPLRIDDLPHDEINIEIGRLNVIECRHWATGLTQLCKKLDADNVPRNLSDPADVVRRWWEREFAPDTRVINEPEVHYSNWFPMQLPPHLYRYSLLGLIDTEPQWDFPTRWHDLRLVTFGTPAEVEPGLGSLRIDRTEQLDTSDFLSDASPQRRDNRNILIELLRDAWERLVLSRGLKSFTMAGGRLCFYFDMDSLPTPHVGFVSIDGTKTRRGLMGYTTGTSGTRRHWHFAISGKPALHPQPLLQLRAHVLFSNDGRTIWSSARAMHRARRSQCKNWWNDDWRDRILATVAWLLKGDEHLSLPLSGGSLTGLVGARPLEFLSPVTLIEPSAALLDGGPDEDDLENEEMLDDVGPEATE